jgi:hypothetical protein
MRRKLIALVIVLLGLGAGVLFTAGHPPFYTSQAQIEVSPGGEWDPASLAVLVSSQPVLVAAAHRPGLNKTVAELKGNLQVAHESLVFTLTAKDQDPGQAKAMASAVIGRFRYFLASRDHVLKKGIADGEAGYVDRTQACSAGYGRTPAGLLREDDRARPTRWVAADVPSRAAISA